MMNDANTKEAQCQYPMCQRRWVVVVNFSSGPEHFCKLHAEEVVMAEQEKEVVA